MIFLDIKYLQEFIEANPLPSTKPCFPDLDPPLNQQKSETYQELLDFLKFDDYAVKAQNELKQILTTNKSLDQVDVKKWTLKHLETFETDFIDFGIKYLDSGNDPDENLHLPHLNEYVSKIPFLSIIKFWKCMWLLSCGEYHLDKENRTPPDPLDYYYSEPDPAEPSDNEKILKYLELD